LVVDVVVGGWKGGGLATNKGDLGATCGQGWLSGFGGWVWRGGVSKNSCLHLFTSNINVAVVGIVE
jgi:hypothetical protein